MLVTHPNAVRGRHPAAQINCQQGHLAAAASAAASHSYQDHRPEASSALAVLQACPGIPCLYLAPLAHPLLPLCFLSSALSGGAGLTSAVAALQTALPCLCLAHLPLAASCPSALQRGACGPAVAMLQACPSTPYLCPAHPLLPLCFLSALSGGACGL